MKTLITGGLGFIGTHAQEWFGECVMDIKNGTFDSVSQGTSLARKLKTVDQVVHLAALTSAPGSIRDPKRYWQTNVEGTRSIIKAWDGPLYFASSAAVHNALNPYALTKRVSEADLKDRPDTTVGRFYNVYGEGGYGVVNQFIKAALEGLPLNLYGDGLQTRSFVDVKDLVNQIHFRGGVDEVATNWTNMKTLAESIIFWLDSKSRIVYAPKRDGDPLYSQAPNAREDVFCMEAAILRIAAAEEKLLK